MTFEIMDRFEYQGIACEVGKYDTLPGIRWRIPAWKMESQGAFYIGEHGYSAGSVIGSAGEKCRRFIDKIPVMP